MPKNSITVSFDTILILRQKNESPSRLWCSGLYCRIRLYVDIKVSVSPTYRVEDSICGQVGRQNIKMHVWGRRDGAWSVRANKNGEEDTALISEQNNFFTEETRYCEKKVPFVAAGTFLSNRCLQTRATEISFDMTRTAQKTTRPTINLLFFAFFAAGKCLPSRCLATLWEYIYRHTY
jgi:hypothetical protein